MTKIGEETKENKSLSSREESVSSERNPKIDQEDLKCQEKLRNYLTAVDLGNYSIFTAYNPQN